MKAKEINACATSHAKVDWHAVDWRTANRNVHRLQTCIVKATQEGRWGKVKALQHLLTHSYSGKVLAVRRVTENQGKHTAGVDREIWNTPTKKAKAVLSLRQRGYRPSPLRRIYIPKKEQPSQVTTAEYPDHDRPGYAGAVSSGTRSGGRNNGRPELLRISHGKVNGRRHRAMLQRPQQEGQRRMDPGRRYKILLR